MRALRFCVCHVLSRTDIYIPSNCGPMIHSSNGYEGRFLFSYKRPIPNEATAPPAPLGPFCPAPASFTSACQTETSLTRIKNCRFSADCGLLRLVENEPSDAHGLVLPHDAGVLGDRGVIKGLTLSIPDPVDKGILDDDIIKLNSPGWRTAFGGVPVADFHRPRHSLAPPAPPSPAPRPSQPEQPTPPLPPLPTLTTLRSPLPPPGNVSTARDEVSANIPSLSDGSTVLESSSLSNTNTVLFLWPSPHRLSPVHPAPAPPVAPLLPRPAAQGFNLTGDGVNPNGDSNRMPSAIPPPAPPTTDVAPEVPAAVAAAVAAAAAAAPAPAVVGTPAMNPSGTHRLWIGGRSSPSSVVRTRNAGGGRLAPVGRLVVGESDETETGVDTRD